MTRSRKWVWTWMTVASLVGIALFLAAATLHLQAYWRGFLESALELLLLNLAALALGTIPVAMWFGWYMQEEMMREVVGDSESLRVLRESGVDGAWAEWRDVEWRAFLETTDSLIVFLAYSRRWLNGCRDVLEPWLDRGGTLTVVLADPEQEATMVELSRRFDQQVDQVKNRIEDHVTALKSLASHKRERKVRVMYFPRALTYSFYLADHRALIALQSHRLDPATPTTVTLHIGHGEVFDWVKAESASVLVESREVDSGLESTDR